MVAEDFTFTPGDAFARTQCFDVLIQPDRLVERSEFFTLVMSSNSEGVMVQPSSARVTITDEDGE